MFQIQNKKIVPVEAWEEYLSKHEGECFDVLPVENQRTGQQNKALHVFFTLLAEALNDAGWDMRRFLKQEISIPWTKDSIKRFLWKPVMDSMLDKESTKAHTTKDIDQVYEVINRAVGERTGVHVPFPERETTV